MLRVTYPRADLGVKDPSVVVLVGRFCRVAALARAVRVVEPLLNRKLVVSNSRLIAVHWFAETTASFIVEVLSGLALLKGAVA